MNFPEKIIDSVLDVVEDMRSPFGGAEKDWRFLKKVKREDLLNLLIVLLGECSSNLSLMFKYFEEEELI